MTRNHYFVAAGGALLLLGVAEILGGGCGCTVHHPGTWSVNTTTKDGVELPYEASLHLGSTERLSRLAVDLESASVVVDGDPSVTGFEADYVVREKTPGDASLAAGPEGVDVKSASGSPVLVTSARLRVPPGTQVEARTAFGSVAVSGIHGAASVVAQTDSGSVTLSDIADVPSVTGTSSFGQVSLSKGAKLAEVTLSTDSGSVSAEGISAATTVTLRSSFGGVKAESVNASESLTLETDSGGVEVADVVTVKARLRSSFGGVTARRSTFDHVYAHTDSGGIRLSACKYKTKDVGTDFGSVKEE